MDEDNQQSKTQKTSSSSSTTRKRKTDSSKKPSENVRKAPKLTALPALPATDIPEIAGKNSVFKAGKTKRVIKKFIGVYHPGNLNTDSHWTFVLASSRNQWIRVWPESITAHVYGTIMVAPAGGGAAVPQALLARSGRPRMWMDPSSLGAGFIKSVQVLINNAPVYTHNFNNHFMHYCRMSRILCNKPGKYLELSTDVDFAGQRATRSAVMIAATQPFDYELETRTTGTRVPIYMHGVWPFEATNKTIDCIDKKKEEPVFLPPGTTLEIKLIPYDGHMASIHLSNMAAFEEYFTADVADPPDPRPNLTFRDLILEYEVSQLLEEDHVKVMQSLQNPENMIPYNYDVVRTQHQSIVREQAYTENSFVIAPYSRFVYVLFVISHAAFPMEGIRKPISGFSRFINHCTKLSVTFGQDSDLEINDLINFGVPGTDHDVSKRQFYKYLRDRNLLPGFDKLFPRAAGVFSVNQILPLDLKAFLSPSSSTLKIMMEFGGGNNSPANHSIIVMSVHPTGRINCQFDPQAKKLIFRPTEMQPVLEAQ